MQEIPSKIADFNLYAEGEVLIGFGDELKLPDLKAITSEIAGGGIAGKIEDPTPGYFDSLEMEIKFRTLSEEASKLAVHKAHTLTARAAQTKHNPADGTNRHEGIKVVTRGITKEFDGGKFKQGEPSDTTIKMELTYYKISRGNETILELDKFNHIYRVGETDYMKEIRDLI